MKKQGFYCRMYGKDCFYTTNQTKRTNKLAEDFILSVQFELPYFPCHARCANDAEIEYVKNNMRKATFEIKTIENGKFKGLSYYEINGENFSYGCDACKSPLVNCVVIG